MNWLLLDGKLWIILFIVGDSGCETEAGFLVIVLVGKPLNIFFFQLKLIFCSCSVVSVFFFFLLLEKSYLFSFALLTQTFNFFSMTKSMFSFQFVFCRHQ